jgi:CTP:molybdopterin cytidylyltransferase MocA
MSGTAAIGMVLAAGAGSRFGMPKALARTDAGTPWLELACRALADGGCGEVIVVLGARADEARRLVPAYVRPVVAPEWRSGIAASLRTVLAAAGETGADAAVVSLVDLPGLRPDAVRRVLGSVPRPDGARQALVRATYGGRPGHPVLVGRAHWPALAAAVHGDTGAGPYLREHGALTVDCTDLGGGDDVDHA